MHGACRRMHYSLGRRRGQSRHRSGALGSTKSRAGLEISKCLNRHIFLLFLLFLWVHVRHKLRSGGSILRLVSVVAVGVHRVSWSLHIDRVVGNVRWSYSNTSTRSRSAGRGVVGANGTGRRRKLVVGGRNGINVGRRGHGHASQSILSVVSSHGRRRGRAGELRRGQLGGGQVVHIRRGVGSVGVDMQLSGRLQSVLLLLNYLLLVFVD